jgi:hypothetical protein
MHTHQNSRGGGIEARHSVALRAVFRSSQILPQRGLGLSGRHSTRCHIHPSSGPARSGPNSAAASPRGQSTNPGCPIAEHFCAAREEARRPFPHAAKPGTRSHRALGEQPLIPAPRPSSANSSSATPGSANRRSQDAADFKCREPQCASPGRAATEAGPGAKGARQGKETYAT